MIDIKKLHTEYITDDKGNKKSVILPIDDFQELLEDIEDLAAVAERRNEATTSHEELLRELKENGII
ncbi:MAG: hypothetical protein ACOCWZ_05530 [Spirochaetota bacterium]